MPNLVTLDAAAERLAVHPKTVRNYIARGELTAYRIKNSRLIRIDSDEVDRLLVPINRGRSRHGRE